MITAWIIAAAIGRRLWDRWWILPLITLVIALVLAFSAAPNPHLVVKPDTTPTGAGLALGVLIAVALGAIALLCYAAINVEYEDGYNAAADAAFVAINTARDAGYETGYETGYRAGEPDGWKVGRDDVSAAWIYCLQTMLNTGFIPQDCVDTWLSNNVPLRLRYDPE